MNVWDGGAHRDVVVVVAQSIMTGAFHARKLVTKLVELFQTAHHGVHVKVDF